MAVIEKFRVKGFKIGLVSNGKTSFQEWNFKALEIDELFDCVFVSAAVGIRKPEKQIFELACRMVDADIGASLFIGDDPVADIGGAKHAGMTTIYLPVDCKHAQCEYADSTFHDFSDLTEYVDCKFWT